MVQLIKSCHMTKLYIIHVMYIFNYLLSAWKTRPYIKKLVLVIMQLGDRFQHETNCAIWFYKPILANFSIL